MGFDRKYGNITTEHGDIPDDEPVFVFRGRDRFLPDVLAYYFQLADSQGSGQHHCGLIEDAREKLLQWQHQNSEKLRTPDSSGPAGQTYWSRNTSKEAL